MPAGNVEKFGDILVSCEPIMHEIFTLMEKIAVTDATVLVTGESGTGKEVLAQAVHNKSRRSKMPFVALNCAAIPDDLIESELFGHVKGAFTGAALTQTGKFEQANGGTLFLDEIGDMSLKTQSKILRAIETREIQPVGSARSMKVDVRIIAATNKDLSNAVNNKEFRQDLFFRINEITVELPPLRKRQADLHLILWDMVEQYNREFEKNVTGISIPALGLLQKHTWPGNIRELRNVVKRIMILISQASEQIFVEHLPFKLISEIDGASSEMDAVLIESPKTEKLCDFYLLFSEMVQKMNEDSLVPLQELEKNYIEQLLKKYSGNKTRTANKLGVDRTTLYDKIKKYKI